MTEARFIDALCSVEEMPPKIWEAFAGDGKLAEVLRSHGAKVIESDIKPRKGQKRLDFLQAKRPLELALVSNPPWSEPVDNMAELVIRQAHRLGITYLAVLLKAHFLNAVCRAELVADIGHPNRIWICDRRPDFTGEGQPPMLCSWYVWSKWGAKQSIATVLRVESRSRSAPRLPATVAGSDRPTLPNIFCAS
jgi:hypothetical protein